MSSLLSRVMPNMKKMMAMLIVVTTFHPLTCRGAGAGEGGRVAAVQRAAACGRHARAMRGATRAARTMKCATCAPGWGHSMDMKMASRNPSGSDCLKNQRLTAGLGA